MDCSRKRVIVIGGGPAGMTVGYEALKLGFNPVILEQGDRVGGISRTATYKGYRFDIGGHRFYTKVSEVKELWETMLGADFLTRPRLSRICYNGQFIDYPLRPINILAKLKPVECLRIVASYVKSKIRPFREAETFEEWVCQHFGERLYHIFFKSYTEKVWGIPCSQIRAEWAAQRIQGMSLKVVLINALSAGRTTTKSLIQQFQYPIHGPGMMWEKFQEHIVKQGGTVQLQTKVIGVKRADNRVSSITIEDAQGIHEIAGDNYVSSMPLAELIQQLDPPPPQQVLDAANGLRYRDFLIVTLILNQSETFPDNWIYIHNTDVRVGRIQNFKNWSAEMVPDQSKTSLGMEYFCNESDELWQMPDKNLVTLAAQEMERLGLGVAANVVDGCVLRQKKAYPVYDGEYRRQLDIIRTYLDRFENLQTIGRNGMHRYNNQDHSMLTGLLAVRNISGESHNLWEVNTDRSYYEDIEIESEEFNAQDFRVDRIDAESPG